MLRRNFLILLSSFLIFSLTEAKTKDVKKESSTKISEEEQDTFYGNLVKLEIPDSYTLKEVIIGDENAPITLVVYSSFTCNHCRKFHLNIFPKFKEQYIDSGKVKVYLRHYLDDVAALEASILVRCVGEDNSETILKMYRKIFENQQSWMMSAEPQAFLKKIFTDSNYESEKIEACLQDKKIPAGLMKEQQRAMQKFHIFSVPAFIRSDGKMHIGKITFEELEEFLGLKVKTQPKEELSEEKSKSILEILKGLLKKPKKKFKKQPASPIAA